MGGADALLNNMSKIKAPKIGRMDFIWIGLMLFLTFKLFVTFQITAMLAVYQSPIDHWLKLIDE